MPLISVAAYSQKKKIVLPKPVANCCVSDEEKGAGMNKFVKDKMFPAAHDTPAPFKFAGNEGNTNTFPTPDDKTGIMNCYAVRESCWRGYKMVGVPVDQL